MLVNFAVLGLALMTITVYLSGRPVMFTVAFLALEVFILSGFVMSGNTIPNQTADAGHVPSRLIWLIPLVTVLWANLHPGFAVAPLVILLFLPLGQHALGRAEPLSCARPPLRLRSF